MRSKVGMTLMGLGILFVAAALCIFLYNRQEDRRAGKAARQVAGQLEEKVKEISAGDQVPSEERIPEGRESAEDKAAVMPEVEIDGYYYIGYLSIEPLELKLPVMSDWSYPQLRISPCRYQGTVATEDLVLMAHNYERHFGNLKNLSAGAPVSFTDMNGTVTQYKVAVVETLEPTAAEEMAVGEYPLTLFTCTYGGGSRVTVRCELAD